jgi:hypothetical protein
MQITAKTISLLVFKRQHLGGGKHDAGFKRHPFFKGVSWSDLAQKKIHAP